MMMTPKEEQKRPDAAQVLRKMANDAPRSTIYIVSTLHVLNGKGCGPSKTDLFSTPEAAYHAAVLEITGFLDRPMINERLGDDFFSDILAEGGSGSWKAIFDVLDGKLEKLRNNGFFNNGRCDGYVCKKCDGYWCEVHKQNIDTKAVKAPVITPLECSLIEHQKTQAIQKSNSRRSLQQRLRQRLLDQEAKLNFLLQRTISASSEEEEKVSDSEDEQEPLLNQEDEEAEAVPMIQSKKQSELAYYPQVWNSLGFKKPLAYYPEVWRSLGFNTQAYYPEVWRSLGFKMVPSSAAHQVEASTALTSKELAYYPEVWRSLGFKKPLAYYPEVWRSLDFNVEAYYPEVWRSLGFKTVPSSAGHPSITEGKKESELAYYPEVWRSLGFNKPLAYYPEVWRSLGFNVEAYYPEVWRSLGFKGVFCGADDKTEVTEAVTMIESKMDEEDEEVAPIVLVDNDEEEEEEPRSIFIDTDDEDDEDSDEENEEYEEAEEENRPGMLDPNMNVESMASINVDSVLRRNRLRHSAGTEITESRQIEQQQQQSAHLSMPVEANVPVEAKKKEQPIRVSVEPKEEKQLSLNSMESKSSSMETKSKEPKHQPNPESLHYNGKGNKAFAERKYDQAIEHYTQAIKLDPKNPTYYSNRSAVWAAKSHWKTSAKDALAYLRLEPKGVKGYVRLAQAQIGLDNVDAAEAAIQKGLFFDKDNSKLLELKGIVRRAKVTKAKSVARDALDAIKRNPKARLGYIRLAAAQIEMEDLKAAAATIQQGLKLDSKNEQLLKQMKTVQKLKEKQEQMKPSEKQQTGQEQKRFSVRKSVSDRWMVAGGNFDV